MIYLEIETRSEISIEMRCVQPIHRFSENIGVVSLLRDCIRFWLITIAIGSKPLTFLLLLFVLTISGCTASYDSLKNSAKNGMQIIQASHYEVKSIAYEAISTLFPAASIKEITGYQSGLLVISIQTRFA